MNNKLGRIVRVINPISKYEALYDFVIYHRAQRMLRGIAINRVTKEIQYTSSTNKYHKIIRFLDTNKVKLISL